MAKTTTQSRAKASPSKAAAVASKKAPPVVVTETAPVLSAPELKKVELIDAVVERSGVKKKFAKPAIEAALAILGESLAEGRDLNLRPLGKVKVQRTKEVANAIVMTTRIRRPNMEATPVEAEDGGIVDAAE
ncbi:HU family DNA-binding protein [Shimia thalassica]|uniref:HU family DNA-binding protein n=1 Tax=Shimia thalassica TaxID=1715693 RepID=UPI0026E37B11|nr:HU family DNA-binding protein [Shimia thalassica]MDO6800260.1 HU family DNA-binding protein [Shimia thalassica]